MSNYEQVLICLSRKKCTRLTTYSPTVRNTCKNKLFQTLIFMLIYATNETLKYFAPKSVRFRIRHTPFILLLRSPVRFNVRDLTGNNVRSHVKSHKRSHVNYNDVVILYTNYFRPQTDGIGYYRCFKCARF